jgi:hypothetical protein
MDWELRKFKVAVDGWPGYHVIVRLLGLVCATPCGVPIGPLGFLRASDAVRRATRRFWASGALNVVERDVYG